MTENVTFEIAQINDVDGVLALQKLYLVTNLTESEKTGGFVTTPFTIPQLHEVIQKQELFVAKGANKIIGYLFTGSWIFFKQWPIFDYMTTLLPALNFLEFEITLTNSFQYGPICIHKEYRGNGLIMPLFEFMRIQMLKKYPLALTFINKNNIPSTKAHVEKLKWTIIGDFKFNKNDYLILAYNLKQPV